MIISRKLSESENVDDVSVMMGTPANKSLLETTGFWHDDFPRRRRMIFAWRSVPPLRMTEWLALAQLDDAPALAQGTGTAKAQRSALGKRLPETAEANMTLISVAGAAELAHQALDRELNVMIFSDNVTLEDEIASKAAPGTKACW
jgi:FdrA protein